MRKNVVPTVVDNVLFQFSIKIPVNGQMNIITILKMPMTYYIVRKRIFPVPDENLTQYLSKVPPLR